MATRMQQRRGTAAQWATANPVLADGEIGYEKDTGVIKIGNGSSTWNALPPALGSSYLPILGKAYDSERLDGLDGSAYAQKTYTDDQDAATLASASRQLISRTVTAAATLALTDVNKTVRVNVAIGTPGTPTVTGVTIPTNATVAIPVGSKIRIENINTGYVDILTAVGVTMEYKTGYPKYRLIQKMDWLELLKTGTDTWEVSAGVQDTGWMPWTIKAGNGFTAGQEPSPKTQNDYRLRNGVVDVNIFIVKSNWTGAWNLWDVPVGCRPAKDRIHWFLGSFGLLVCELKITGMDELTTLACSTVNAMNGIVAAVRWNADA